METFSTLLAFCAGNSTVTGEFPAQRPVKRSFDVFFDLHLNKRMSKQWWGWWFEMPSCPLWRHCNALFHCGQVSQFWVTHGPEPWFNIKMTSYQYRKSHCGDKTILRPSYLHNGISYTGKRTSLYWIRAQVMACCLMSCGHNQKKCLFITNNTFPINSINIQRMFYNKIPNVWPW